MMIGKTNAQTTTNFIDVPNDIITISGTTTTSLSGNSPQCNLAIAENIPSLCGNENLPIKLKNGVSYYFAQRTSTSTRYSIALSNEDKHKILSQMENLKASGKTFNVIIWAGLNANSTTGIGIFNLIMINPSTSNFNQDTITGYSTTNTIRIMYINES